MSEAPTYRRNITGPFFQGMTALSLGLDPARCIRDDDVVRKRRVSAEAP